MRSTLVLTVLVVICGICAGKKCTRPFVQLDDVSKKCYFIFNTVVTWAEAKAYCIKYSMAPLYIDTRAEELAVVSWLTHAQWWKYEDSHRFWFGGGGKFLPTEVYDIEDKDKKCITFKNRYYPNYRHLYGSWVYAADYCWETGYPVCLRQYKY